MPWGAIIGAVASVAGTAISASSKGGSGGAPKTSKISLQGVNLDDPSAILGMFTNQMQAYPGLRQAAQQLNTSATQDYTSLINTLYPGTTQQLGEVSNLAQSYLKGQIPADVQAQIQRATAQQALQGGFSGTGMGGNLTARDLGLTSMNLTQQGVNMFSTGLNLAKGMIPGYVNPASLMFSPTQLMNRADQASYYNTDITNQTKLINAGWAQNAAAIAQANKAQQGSTIASGISSLFGSGSNPSGLSKTIGGWLNKAFGSTSDSSSSGSTDYSNPNFDLGSADQAAQDAGYSSYAAMTAAGAV